MATDYDAPRKTEEDLSEDSLQELQARRSDKNSGVVDEDETEAAEGFELPGADLSGEELSVRVLPRQADEFTCSSCFLVHHRSQLAYERDGRPVCSECATSRGRSPVRGARPRCVCRLSRRRRLPGVSAAASCQCCSAATRASGCRVETIQ